MKIASQRNKEKLDEFGVKKFLKMNDLHDVELQNQVIDKLIANFQEEAFKEAKKIRTKVKRSDLDQWRSFEKYLHSENEITSIEIVVKGATLKFDIPMILAMFKKMKSNFSTSNDYDDLREHEEIKEGYQYFQGKIVRSLKGEMDIPELDLHNGIKSLRAQISYLVDNELIKSKSKTARQKNIITYELLEAAKILPLASTDTSMSSFINKHVKPKHKN